ncbi:molybdenum ABC transporter ATP-binding protein [Desulfofustis limnaeus]|jgi:molybdate transport system ATP-binding protein|uniref:Molybdenum ABC transporter ATP-binding protein n=1 Tax=Desulfofustis limnaeus TaxID=2740163 RepID=A0ABN6M0Z5_9BACT|nr:molybdenum ABC transporter ATP-binding protein [Desulfofustis limnaeus]MDX9895977.1 molybdenum ABC transporter ATP-binding protein [Desulfofustis sp.]BDD86510.1 molybdenum ABC transporter ATP-binding protein [Desulfofustis limnaeus]
MRLEIDVEKQLGAFFCRIDCRLESESCGVFGPSGSGKTTLMNMLAGLVPPDRGRITLDGVPLFDHRAGINHKPEKRRIGVVFQHAFLFEHLNVRNNLLYGMKRTPQQRRSIDPVHLFRALDLEHLLERRVTRLSGGERQRVALGRAMLASPRLILLDEPLTGLDRALKFRIIPHLRQVFTEFSIPYLFISHSHQEMRLMTKDVLIMEQGQVARLTTTEELARSTAASADRGYTNFLEFENRQDCGNLLTYQWGTNRLTVVKTVDAPESAVFSLSARDIVLFKRHPEASSARNILVATVRSTQLTDWLVRVELDCYGRTLIAEIVPQSMVELGIRPGTSCIVVFKASALRRLT